MNQASLEFFEASSALLEATRLGNKKVVKILLSRGADPNAKSRYGGSLYILHTAIRGGNVDLVKLLVAYGAELNNSHLRVAASMGNREIIEFLLEHGVKANANILDVAVKNRHQQIVKLLLARGVETNPYAAAMTGDMATVKEYLERGMDVDDTKSDRYPTLLQIAAGTGQKTMVEYLLCAGAELNTCSGENLTSTALHTAVRNGHREIVTLLLERGAIVNAIYSSHLKKNWQTTPLHWVTSPEIAQLLLDAGAILDATDINNSTPLHSAVERGDRSVVEYLIEQGANIACQNQQGQTPLHLAPNREIVELLLAHGAESDVRNSQGGTPVDEAVKNQHLDVVELFIERGVVPNLPKDINASLAHYAERGWLKMVELLISQGADVNHPGPRLIWEDWRGPIKDFTPLHLAAANGHLDVAECLIANGARLDVFGGEDRITPLHCAVWKSHLDVVKLLLERGADVNIQRTEGGLYYSGEGHREGYALWSASMGTPLHVVWDKDIAAFLIAEGADVNARDSKYDRTPLHLIVEKFFGEIEEIVEILILNGADVNAKDCHGSTPLHLAVEYGKVEIIQQLLVAGDADVDGNSKTNTPLFLALSKSQLDIAEMLIFNGADVNARNSKGETILHQAVKKGSLDLVELAIAAGADVNAKDKDANTPLTVALENSYIEKVQLLIANNANVNLVKNKHGDPLLHELIERRQIELAQMLIYNGADLKVRDQSDRSVLHAAVQSNLKEIVELLLLRGADLNAKRKASFTPLDDAIKLENWEVADLLVARGAVVNKQQVARISALLSLPDALAQGYVNLVARIQI